MSSVAVDDRTFRWVLKKPYPKMLLALGKISTPCCFIMPARIAATDPFKQTGEVDWWEIAIPDLVPLLRKNRNIAVDIQDRLGNNGILAINHLFAPFNDVRARRAILTAMSQEEYMRAYVGDDASLWKPLPGYFPPGSPLYSEEGGDILSGPRKLDAAKRLIAESGYAGEPIVCLAAQDVPHTKAWGDVTVDLLKRLDLNVDFAAVDWGTVVARRAQKKPPSQGGWHMFHTSIYGIDAAAPTSPFVHADGSSAVNGWANSPAVEGAIAAWLDATTDDGEKAAAARLNKAFLDHVVYAPLGWYLRYYAWRRSLTGITQGPLPFFWGVSKTV